MINKNISSPTAAKILAAWESEGRSERPRTYLGASIIGDPCDMKLWLYFRAVCREMFDGRMYRLFDRGKREEAVFCADLRKIGCEVKEFDDKGSQFSVSDFGGHFGGHLDGVVRGIPEAPKAWHVAEFKTHSDASFKKLCKEGVKAAKPMHYDQMTVYMGKTGIERALYMAVNKDTDDLWCERIEFDRTHYDRVMARAKRIIDTVSPDRCASRPDDFRCKSCCCHAVCWHETGTLVEPSVPENCMTCCHATADTEHDGARWNCRIGHACNASVTNCADHLVLPSLVNGEIVDGDSDGITYSHKDSWEPFTIGKRGMSVAEAKRVWPKDIHIVKTVKDEFPESSVVGSNKLALKYSNTEKYDVYFHGTMDEFEKWRKDNKICDWSNPVAQEECGCVRYFEYLPTTLLVIDKDDVKVFCELTPF